jgi:predicted secreted protein
METRGGYLPTDLIDAFGPARKGSIDDDEETVILESLEPTRVDEEALRNGRRVIGDTKDSIEIKVGDEFAVRMKALPSTGYGWKWVRRPDDRLIGDLGVENEPPEDDCPGSTHYFYLMFRALAAGETELELNLVPPWEGPAQAVRELRISIRAS